MKDGESLSNSVHAKKGSSRNVNASLLRQKHITEESDFISKAARITEDRGQSEPCQALRRKDFLMVRDLETESDNGILFNTTKPDSQIW